MVSRFNFSNGGYPLRNHTLNIGNKQKRLPELFIINFKNFIMKRNFIMILTIAISTFTLFAQEPQSDGLWAYYMFNGNADNEIVDTSGTVYNATLTTDRFGRDNSCYKFVRNDSSVISFGDSYDTLFAGDNKSFALSVWIKPDTISQNMMIVGKYGHGIEHNREFFMRILDTVVDFGFYSSLGGGNAVIYRSETRIEDTTHWYNIVVNYYDTALVDTFTQRVEMFIDNNKENLSINLAQTTSPTFIKDGTSPLCIGGILATNDSSHLGFGYNGKIDDLILYSKTLSSSEVNSLYNDDPLSSSIIESSNTVEEAINQQDVLFYPNPVNETLFINFQNRDTKTVEAIDITGKIVYSTTTNASLFMIDVDKLGQGSSIFFIRVLDENNNILSRQKVIKSR
jgi:hypothetical protein